MAEAISALNRISAAWAATMGAVIWQSVLLTLIAAAILCAWRRLPPAGRCWVWRIVAVKLLLLPFWSASVPVPKWLGVGVTSVAAEPIVVANDEARRITSPDLQEAIASDAVGPKQIPLVNELAAVKQNAPRVTWQAWLGVVWLCVIAVQVGRLWLQRASLLDLLRASRRAPETIAAIVAEQCQRLGVATSVETRLTEAEVSPFVCRPAKPLMVIPETIVAIADEARLRQIVLHELAHVRRCDLVWCWVAHFARIVFWFHPAVHWIAFREALERELACDALAMAHSGTTPADYAQTLVDTVDQMSRPESLRNVVEKLTGGAGRVTIVGH